MGVLEFVLYFELYGELFILFFLNKDDRMGRFEIIKVKDLKLLFIISIKIKNIL